MVDLRGEMTELRTEEARLRAQYELAYDLEGIEAAMTADGTMVKPQNGQTIYVDLSEPDSVTLFDQEEVRTGAAGFVDSLRALWDDVVSYFQ